MKYKRIPNQLFIKNRSKLKELILPGSTLIIHSNDDMHRNGDQNFRFRQSSDFFYLTGIDQEKSILVMNPMHPEERFREVLFIIKSTPAQVTWNGYRLDIAEASEISGIKNFIFGSSSSVYGENKKIPFSENDNVDYPISPYAASKKACELFCYTYSHLTNLNIVCLRFFTVYGPQGRPDMAPYLFTEWIHQGKELIRYGNGTTRRDYTYIDDIIQGILVALEKNFKFEIINLGNSQTVELSYFINVIENLLGKKALIKEMPEQPGDVPLTYADISKAQKLLEFNPKTKIEEGMEKFVKWYLNNQNK